MNKEKITFDMSMKEVLMTMSEGNIGALNVLIKMLKESPFGLLDILPLDSMEIRGEQIWRLYKDCSGENYEKFIRTINALRMGEYTSEEITANLTNNYYSIPFIEDETISQGFPSYDEEFRPTDQKWADYMEANKRLVKPKIKELIQSQKGRAHIISRTNKES